MSLIFRRATAADIAAMSAIRLAVTENVLRNPGRITVQMYHDYLELLGRGWVCTSNGAVVGFSYAARADASIWALFVHPLHEGRGIGKQLLALAADWLFEGGADVVTLGTSANTRADRFYSAQGWQRGAMKDAVEVVYALRSP